MELDTSKFKDVFLSEFEEHLQMLEGNLVKLEKDSKNQKLLDELMRSAHTIKGSSSTMGYNQTAFLTHVLEDIFDYARNLLLELTPNIISQLFLAIDSLKISMKQIQSSDKEANLSEISEEIKNITGVSTVGTGKSHRGVDGKPIVIISPESANIPTLITTENAVETSVERTTHIKVPVSRLDALMDLMEELLIDKMKLEAYYKSAENDELSAIVNHLSRLVSNIQYQVMQTRLVALDQSFLRFPRMVRDLSQKYNKEITLEISGGDLELDRTIIDQLSEPLIHLLRNAVDHGVQSKGKIKMNAIRVRDRVRIIIEDNGGGIEWAKLVKKGIEKNLILATEIELYKGYVKDYEAKISNEYNNKEQMEIDSEFVASSLNENLVELLYQGRLSTNDIVTETSGRGVGLSIVKQFVQQLGGNLIIESPTFTEIENGQLLAKGTRFIMELPLSIAIMRTLLVEIMGEVFAVPFTAIERSVFIAKENVKEISNQMMAVIDEVGIPIVNLEKLFVSLEHKQKVANVDKKEEGKDTVTIVLINKGKEIVGIIVDKLVREQEIIVKPMPSLLRGINGFSGSTVLENGNTVLILDAITLLEETKRLS